MDILQHNHIVLLLSQILANQEKIMSTVTDLQNALDTIKTGVATLLAQPPPVEPVTQAQLDSLTAEAQAIVATLPAAAPTA